MKRGLAAFLLVAGPACAEAPAAVQPTRDVDVSYKVPVGDRNLVLMQRLRFSAALHKQRVDLPTSGNWMVLDFTAHRMAMMRDDSREIIDMDAPPTPVPAGAGFTRMGATSIAGLACTEWRTTDTRGRETVACYTQDGVLLQARTASAVLMQAVSVSFAAQDAAVFTLPAGYTRTATP